MKSVFQVFLIFFQLYQVHKVSNILFCSGKKIQNDFNTVIEGYIFLSFIKGFVAIYLGYLDTLLFSPFFHFIRIEFVLILKIYLYFCTKYERAFKFPMISFLSKKVVIFYQVVLIYFKTQGQNLGTGFRTRNYIGKKTKERNDHDRNTMKI